MAAAPTNLACKFTFPRLCGAAAVLFGTAAVNALAAPGAAETYRPHLPFNAMNPIPTPAPLDKVVRHQLGRRADGDPTPILVAPDNTCGYLSGLSAASYICVNPSATCILVSSTSSVNGLVGCCAADSCAAHATCFDSSQIASSTSASIDTDTLQCSESTLAFCNSVSFPGGAVDYFCNDVSATNFILAETNFLGQSGRTFQTLDIAVPVVTSDTSTELASRSSPVLIPPISNIETIFTTQTPTTDENNKCINAGAVAGGAAGGVAVIALVALGIWLMLRKNKKNKARAATTQPATTITPGQPQPQQKLEQQLYQTYDSASPQYRQPGHQSVYYDPNNPNTQPYNRVHELS